MAVGEEAAREAAREAAAAERVRVEGEEEVSREVMKGEAAMEEEAASKSRRLFRPVFFLA